MAVIGVVEAAKPQQHKDLVESFIGGASALKQTSKRRQNLCIILSCNPGMGVVLVVIQGHAGACEIVHQDCTQAWPTTACRVINLPKGVDLHPKCSRATEVICVRGPHMGYAVKCGRI